MARPYIARRAFAALMAFALGASGLVLSMASLADVARAEPSMSLVYATYVLPRLAMLPFGTGMCVLGVCVLAGDRCPEWCGRFGACLLLVSLGAIVANIVCSLVGLILTLTTGSMVH